MHFGCEDDILNEPLTSLYKLLLEYATLLKKRDKLDMELLEISHRPPLARTLLL